MACGADTRVYANLGKMPTVLLSSGTIHNAHQPNEFVEVDDLVNAVPLSHQLYIIVAHKHKNSVLLLMNQNFLVISYCEWIG